jgi:hypothetical protein
MIAGHQGNLKFEFAIRNPHSSWSLLSLLSFYPPKEQIALDHRHKECWGMLSAVDEVYPFKFWFLGVSP